ncbi:MAG: hypothetical protein PWQ44_1354 [Methanolobus sp.]|nr:hypothetical protein [Methanolobus sp.]
MTILYKFMFDAINYNHNDYEMAIIYRQGKHYYIKRGLFQENTAQKRKSLYIQSTLNT